jgi:hypothetical protein
MKTQKYEITVKLVTNLPIDSPMVRDALEKMIYNHPDYDKDETVAAIPEIKVRNWSL